MTAAANHAADAPGAYRLSATGGDIELNAGRATATISVTNSGDRPIQVGSHFCFFEVNRALVFTREQARGMRLDIPAGTAVRFEPGEARPVNLVALGGERLVLGHNNFTTSDDAFTAGGDAGAST